MNEDEENADDCVTTSERCEMRPEKTTHSARFTGVMAEMLQMTKRYQYRNNQQHEVVESPPPPPTEKPPIDETTEQTDSTVASNPAENVKKKTPPSKPIRRSSQRSLASSTNSPRCNDNIKSPESDASHHTPSMRREERRSNYEKRRDQRLEKRKSSDSDKDNAALVTSTPQVKEKMKKSKKTSKSNATRRQSIQQQNDEASPTEADRQNKQGQKQGQTNQSEQRRAILQTLPLSSSSSDESEIDDETVLGHVGEPDKGPKFHTFMKVSSHHDGDNDSSKLSNKIAKLKEDEYAKRQHELNTSLVIKMDPVGSDDTDTQSENLETSPFLLSKNNGHFTYLDADEEILEPYDKLGWFDGRPAYYYAESTFIIMHGISAVLNWFAISMCLVKSILGIIGIPRAFLIQLIFSTLGLLHLMTLPLLDNFEFIRKSKLLLRHSKTSALLRRVLANWERRQNYFCFNIVAPWNTILFCRNYNNQRRNLERNIHQTSSFVTKLTKQKIKNLKTIQDRLLFSSSSYRDPFQFFIMYNLFIQITGNRTSDLAIAQQDTTAHYFDKLLIVVCSSSMLLNLFFIFLNLTQRIGAWYEAQTGEFLHYGARTLYLISATCQAIVVILFCNCEHEHFFVETILQQSRTKQAILAAKIIGIFVINVMLFSLRTTTDVKGRMVAIFRRSFSSIMFWSPDINNEREILSTKDLAYFVVFMLIRMLYITLLWVFIDRSVELDELPFSDDGIINMESRHSIFISVMIIASCICIIAHLLLYFVLKDAEFCKKILLYLLTTVFAATIVAGMFLLLPRSNNIWSTLFDFNYNKHNTNHNSIRQNVTLSSETTR